MLKLTTTKRYKHGLAQAYDDGVVAGQALIKLELIEQRRIAQEWHSRMRAVNLESARDAARIKHERTLETIRLLERLL